MESFKADLSQGTKRDTDFAVLRDASNVLWLNAGGWASDSWYLLNEYLFDSRLTFNGIELGLTPHGHALGYYRSDWNRITLHSSLLPDYKLNRGGRRNPWRIGYKLGMAHVLEVLLHEMCHQAGHQFGLRLYKGEDSHNSHKWSDVVNEISGRVGLGDYFLPVYKRMKLPKDEDGKRKNIWVPREPDVVSAAEARGLKIAPQKSISSWPSSLRPANYYQDRRNSTTEVMIQEWKSH